MTDARGVTAAMHGISYDTERNAWTQSSLHLIIAESYARMQDHTARSTYFLSLATTTIPKLEPPPTPSYPAPPPSSRGHQNQNHSHKHHKHKHDRNRRRWYELSSRFHLTGGRNRLNEGRYGEAIGFLSRHLFYAAVLYGPQSIELDRGNYLLGRAFSSSVDDDDGGTVAMDAAGAGAGAGAGVPCERAVRCYDRVVEVW